MDLAAQFFSALPSNISFDDAARSYIQGKLADANDEASLREATESLLSYAGLDETEINALYGKIDFSTVETDAGHPQQRKEHESPRIDLPANTPGKTSAHPTRAGAGKRDAKPKTAAKQPKDVESDLEIVAYSQQSRFHTETLETLSKEVDLRDVNITVGGKELLADTRLQLKSGVHYGLIGRNGVGKSTLLQCIGRGKLVGFPENVRVLYIEQLENVDESRIVTDIVVAADKERTRLLREKQLLQTAVESSKSEAISKAVRQIKVERLERELEVAEKTAIKRSGRRGAEARQELIEAEGKVATAKSALEKERADANEDYAATAHELLEDVYTNLNQIGADSAEARAQEILSGLGFSKKQQHSPMATLSSLSGGWRMRVALAQALFVQPDVLLLDEPTNHLDLPAILWLQSYLNTLADTTLVIVSHDRRFLNKTVEEIIRFKDQKLTYHTGNYDEYEKNMENERLKKERMYEAQEKQKKHMEESIQKAQRKAKESGDDKRLNMAASRKKKLENRMGMNRTEDGFRFKLNKHRAGFYNSIRDEIVLEKADAKVRWDIPEPVPLRHQGPLLQVENVTFTYPNAKTPVLKRGVTLSVEQGDRIGLVGANGSGKSTLMGLLSGDLQPTRGSVQQHPRMQMSYYAQHHVDSLDLDASGVVYMMRELATEGVTEQQARAHLGKFGIGGDLALRRMRHLSGGQRCRVAFAVQAYIGPHVLLLDEITNHLDMHTIEAIVGALEAYAGAVIVVSHDRYFVQRVTRRVYAVRRGGVEELKGGVDDYVRDVARDIGVDVDELEGG